jgi:hypothetical protein
MRTPKKTHRSVKPLRGGGGRDGFPAFDGDGLATVCIPLQPLCSTSAPRFVV